MSKFHLEPFCATIEKFKVNYERNTCSRKFFGINFKITHVHLVTPCVYRIIEAAEIVSKYDLTSLRSVNTASTTLPEPLAVKLKDLLGLEDMRQGK